ncbi:MAG TPA: hypothetical protein VM659_15270 [Dongiaceae bacterium]|nr:hypothetical protein [Dongiaceae bacterium]
MLQDFREQRRQPLARQLRRLLRRLAWRAQSFAEWRPDWRPRDSPPSLQTATVLPRGQRSAALMPPDRRPAGRRLVRQKTDWETTDWRMPDSVEGSLQALPAPVGPVVPSQPDCSCRNPLPMAESGLAPLLWKLPLPLIRSYRYLVIEEKALATG